MRSATFLALSAAAGFALSAAENIPDGYTLAYRQGFDDKEALEEFVMSDSKAWKFAEEEKGGSLELAAQSSYKPAVRSPFNIALIKGKSFGDFILEADVVQTGKEYGHRDMCFFFGFQDPAHFYYAHIATKTDDHAHNIFIVNNEPRTKISKTTTEGVNWGLNIWHKVRIERTLEDGLTKVYFDDMTIPIMTAQDKEFGEGFIGFGSFDDTGKVDNVRIWTKNPPASKNAPDFGSSK